MVANPRGLAVVYADIALSVLVTIFVLLRVLARQRSKLPFGADDWLVIATMLPFFVMSGLGDACT